MQFTRQINSRRAIRIEQGATPINHPAGEIGHAGIPQVDKKCVLLKGLGKTAQLGEKEASLGIDQIQHVHQVTEGDVVFTAGVACPHHGGDHVTIHDLAEEWKNLRAKPVTWSEGFPVGLVVAKRDVAFREVGIDGATPHVEQGPEELQFLPVHGEFAFELHPPQSG